MYLAHLRRIYSDKFIFIINKNQTDPISFTLFVLDFKVLLVLKIQIFFYDGVSYEVLEKIPFWVLSDAKKNIKFDMYK
ncbi:hypothetical protein GCM10009119_12660 [Algoriphagus jejuensis]|uniref:Uncharacterized protein n=1 Tax=Algoriphagus jejuensis TaxID=419934 RepID=A0ABP3YBL5_9BACT